MIRPLLYIEYNESQKVRATNYFELVNLLRTPERVDSYGARDENVSNTVCRHAFKILENKIKETVRRAQAIIEVTKNSSASLKEISYFENLDNSNNSIRCSEFIA